MAVNQAPAANAKNHRTTPHHLLSTSHQRHTLPAHNRLPLATTASQLSSLEKYLSLFPCVTAQRRLETAARHFVRSSRGRLTKRIIKHVKGLASRLWAAFSCQSGVMDRLARNLDDLRQIVQGLNDRGVSVEFVKEKLHFTGDDSPLSKLMLSVMGAFAEFECALIRERQREGIALAKQRGAYRGRQKSLSVAQVAEMRERVAAKVPKAQIERDLSISRETLYQYLRAAPLDSV
jgi:hypothetical protein